MKLFKKVLLALIAAGLLVYIMPTIMPINESGYTVSAASVKISKTKYKMNKGEKYTLKITGTSKKVTWSTSNKKIATVDSKGKVTAKKKGTATITAKVGSKKFKCKITVEAPSISKKSYTMQKGKSYTLKISGTTQKISWSSSNKNVATVSSKGKVTAKNIGTATITAKVGKSKYTCKITVKESFNGKTYTLRKGYYIELTISNTSKRVVWTTSNKNAVSVTPDSTTYKCKVVAEAPGTATIKATVGTETFSCKIIVPDFRQDFEVTTKASHYSSESFPVVVTYVKNKTSIPYVVLMGIKYYDSDNNVAYDKSWYSYVGGNGIDVTPVLFSSESLNDYASYTVEIVDVYDLSDSCEIENNINCAVNLSEYDATKNWYISLANNSGKALTCYPQYTVIGYNSNGGINYYCKYTGSDNGYYSNSGLISDSSNWGIGETITVAKTFQFVRKSNGEYLTPLSFETYAHNIVFTSN